MSRKQTHFYSRLLPGSPLTMMSLISHIHNDDIWRLLLSVTWMNFFSLHFWILKITERILEIQLCMLHVATNPKHQFQDWLFSVVFFFFDRFSSNWEMVKEWKWQSLIFSSILVFLLYWENGPMKFLIPLKFLLVIFSENIL